jgi:hypothetical protein
LPIPTDYYPVDKIFTCLRLKQRNVDNYQLRGILGDAGWQVFAAEKEDVEDLARIKHLQMFALDPHEFDPEMYQEVNQEVIVLTHLPELTSLGIEGWYSELGIGDLGLDYQTLFFGAVKLWNQHPWLNNLHLDAVDLSCDNDMFPRLESLQSLKKLQLIRCGGYNAFLEMLTTLSLDLDSLSIEDTGGYLHTRTNTFIRSMNSLQRLALYIDADFEAPYEGLLDWTALQTCASAIQCLKVQYRGLNPLFPSHKIASDFRRFCNIATNLQQLSFSGIDVEPDSWVSSSGNLGHFLVNLHSRFLPGTMLSLTKLHRIAYTQHMRSQSWNSRCGYVVRIIHRSSSPREHGCVSGPQQTRSSV